MVDIAKPAQAWQDAHAWSAAQAQSGAPDHQEHQEHSGFAEKAAPTLPPDSPTTPDASIAEDKFPRALHERLANFLVLMRAVVDLDGVQAGVQLANAWTAHRYTGLYCIEGERLVCLALWDKAQSTLTSGGDIAVYESYCIYILQSGSGFTVLDAVSDARVTGHPKRTVYRSYCGAPLIDRQGQVVGTFCHFDEAPGRVAPADFELVHIAAALVSERMVKDNRVLCGHTIKSYGLCRDSASQGAAA